MWTVLLKESGNNRIPWRFQWRKIFLFFFSFFLFNALKHSTCKGLYLQFLRCIRKIYMYVYICIYIHVYTHIYIIYIIYIASSQYPPFFHFYFRCEAHIIAISCTRSDSENIWYILFNIRKCVIHRKTLYIVSLTFFSFFFSIHLRTFMDIV